MYTAVVDASAATRIAAAGYDVASSRTTASGRVRIDLVLYPRDVDGLEKLGVRLHVWRSDRGLTAIELADRQRARGYRVWRPYDGPNGFRVWMERFAAANPDLVKLEVIGHTWGTDPEGGPDTPRDIVALKLTDGAAAEADGSRPAVLYASLQHAREWISGEVTRRLLMWFVHRYRASDAKIRNLLGGTELWFMPVANPDGYQYTFDHDRLWRKNLRDNDGDGLITGVDGVDPNRNFPDHWNYDEEGSSSTLSDETYRGPAPASEPETQAIIGLLGRVPFRFLVNYHSFAREILASFGWQDQTPSADDPILVALSGTDRHPAVKGFDPGVGADLYTTNGDTTDFSHDHGTLAWTVELDGKGGGFVFPDDPILVRREFRKNLPFALSVARSASDPADPVSSVGISTKPFYLDMSKVDPQRAHNPLSDFTFDVSYGSPQPVEVLARRDLDGDGVQDPVTVHWRVNGGPRTSAPTSEWNGGERYGGPGDVYYRVVRGNVTGFHNGDTVKVWFTGGGRKSGSFTFDVAHVASAQVLILAAEDYSGAANWPEYGSSTSPNYLHYYTDALDATGVSWDVYDVDAMGREAPDDLGVLSHYRAVIWYTGNDYLTREPRQEPGTGASTLANSEMLEVRAYLNEGGRLLYTGAHAGWQYASGYPYNPVRTPPFCLGTVPTNGVGCRALSDDFLQYWLGASFFIEDGGTDPSGEPFGIDGTGGPFAGTGWTLDGGDGADTMHPNPIRGTTQSLLTTSSLLRPDQYPQFTSTSAASWATGQTSRLSPHSGSGYAYSGRSDISYKRLMNTVDVPTAGGDLSFWISRDTEPGWDYVFVEAHTPGKDDWVTLPDLNGHTHQRPGPSCRAGWFKLHPWLERYEGADCTGAGWNAASGRSSAWEPWSVDLSPWAGKQVEVSISYASDWSYQGLGVFVDDINAPGTTGDAAFESGLDGWRVAGPPRGSQPNTTDWAKTGDVGFSEAAAVETAPPDSTYRTLYLAFAFEAITSASERADVMGRAVNFLLGP
jgi:hypothetical protein